VDLGAFELTLGSQVVVVIETKSDCGVKVINPQVLEVRSTCTYAFSGLDLEGQSLSWKTNGESGALPFVVQQYRWGRWSVVGEVPGQGGGVKNSYTIPVDMHHGENRFRIYQQERRIAQLQRPHHGGQRDCLRGAHHHREGQKDPRLLLKKPNTKCTTPTANWSWKAAALR